MKVFWGDGDGHLVYETKLNLDQQLNAYWLLRPTGARMSEQMGLFSFSLLRNLDLVTVCDTE